MSGTADVIIIGAGHNGLITAFYLARAGFRPLILESRDLTGGCVANETFAPGYQAPLANSIGPLRGFLHRDDADLAAVGAVILESDAARNLCVECVVLAEPDIQAGTEPSSVLAHKNGAAGHQIPVVPLDAEALRVAVSSVA